VVHGLARTSLARGHNVSVLMPFYECLPQDQIEGLGFEMEVDVPKGYTWDGVMQVGVTCCPGVRLCLPCPALLAVASLQGIRRAAATILVFLC
jgi:hypothetical protein